MSKKTWTQKLHNGKSPEVVAVDKPFWGLVPGDKLLISTPAEIKGEVDRIPMGKTLSIPELRDKLAARHKANATCPMTTGIFLRIVSEAALEDLANGKNTISPFWRIVEPKSPLAKKLTCGPEFIIQRRAAEGIA